MSQAELKETAQVIGMTYSTTHPKPQPSMGKGLRFTRRFSKDGVHPFDEVSWEKRDAVISGGGGKVVFKQPGVEFPTTWSQQATNVVVNKYFRGKLGTPQRESSVKQMISRVSGTIANWGRENGYFQSAKDADVFEDELTAILLQQRMAFNSPVWFNVGIEAHPQCSACFINSVEDTMSGIMELARTEAMLFKGGSGAGTNLSPIRSSMEHLQGGGQASGPVSFMKGFDAFAGVIKSGGKTRRAAKMVILDVGHPDVEEFINCKMEEERKAWTLIDAGYDSSLDGPAYGSIFFQNSNNSVRVTDEFMDAVLGDKNWDLRAVTNKEEILKTVPARSLMDQIANAAHTCGDPGMQYDTTINDWHTCPNTGRINASNPCSEYMFLDDTACNLASLNLMKFYDFKTDAFDVEAYRHATRVTITAMEIIVDNASYPTPKIGENSHKFRPLGIGYANLGALLMAKGIPYDSDLARGTSACLTAILTGEAYRQSAVIAGEMGPFEGYKVNEGKMLGVMDKHRKAAYAIHSEGVEADLVQASHQVWDECVTLGERFGYRNSQASVIAPTGTISFLMDCDTTGIEPDIALVKHKALVGGGYMNMVNRTVPLALQRLGYSQEEISEICDYLEKNSTIEGAPRFKEEHLPVFDCAFKSANGVRSIHYMGHIRMMAACQPFLSGAISKTVNMPESATIEDIKLAYMESWKMGLKAVAIYRDGSKRTQPLSTGTKEQADKKDAADAAVVAAPAVPTRRRLPNERKAITHKFCIAGHEGYLHIGLYEDGNPGEIFIRMAKEGSTISGLMDAFATSISIALQYGVPLDLLVNKFSHMRFEPSGMTLNPEIPFAKSITDYIFRYLASRFLAKEDQKAVGIIQREPAVQENQTEPLPLPMPLKLVHNVEEKPATPRVGQVRTSTFQNQQDAPGCQVCGTIMFRAGSCYTCPECGATSGCG